MDVLKKVLSSRKGKVLLAIISGLLVVVVFAVLSNSVGSGFPVMKYNGVTFKINSVMKTEYLKKKFPYKEKGGSYWELDGYLTDTVAIKMGNDDRDYRISFTIAGWQIDHKAKNASVNGIRIGDSDKKVMRKFAKAQKDNYYGEGNYYDIRVYFDENGKQIKDSSVVWKADGVNHYWLSFHISSSGKVSSISFSDIGSE